MKAVILAGGLGTRISEELLKQYDKEMTIVLQNQYWDLKVTESAFEVGLSFNGQPEMLHIPFAAIKSFFDPSVQFALQFDPATAPDDREAEQVAGCPAWNECQLRRLRHDARRPRSAGCTTTD